MDDPSMYFKLEEQQGFHNSVGQTSGRRRTRSARREFFIDFYHFYCLISDLQIHINDNFAKFSEALYIADRHAREEVRQRALMQQKLAQKEKEAKEENLRLMAQRAREERGGIAPKPSAQSAAALKSSLAEYGSDGSGDESEASNDSAEDEEARKIREQMRLEKRREREREMRMSNMGQEQRAKMLARQQNRDISEKVALGLAKPTLSKESMLDSRLFNQESLSSNFADDDAYNLYDKPLFHGSTAAAAIYKARGNIQEGDEDSFGGGTEEGITKALDQDRFNLGRAKVGFEGAQDQEVKEGPVQFEKDTGDVFGVNQFLDEAKTGRKRGLDTSACVSLQCLLFLYRMVTVFLVVGLLESDKRWTEQSKNNLCLIISLI